MTRLDLKKIQMTLTWRACDSTWLDKYDSSTSLSYDKVGKPTAWEQIQTVWTWPMYQNFCHPR